MVCVCVCIELQEAYIGHNKIEETKRKTNGDDLTYSNVMELDLCMLTHFVENRFEQTI